MHAEDKKNHARVAFALLCGLAVCCSVMYLSADAGTEFVHETIISNSVEVDAGVSVGTADVLKAGQLYTETPRGNQRLMDYFSAVEADIAKQVATRKADIASVRAQMARDAAYNAAARASLKRDMQHKMAQNAKIARDNLNREMRRTQARMARNADLENRRDKANKARDAATSAAIAQDKKEAEQSLKDATAAWQAKQDAWEASTNAKITKMNADVNANAARIKENAKKARKDLESTMADWDHKVATFRSDEAAKNSKLSAQFAAQDKATRAWANNKIKAMVAETASQFNDVKSKMAKNRQEVDMALQRAAARFAASLNAAKALEDKRFQQTVADIAATRKESEDKLSNAKSQFKVALLSLSSTVKEQVSSVNKNIDKLAGTVRSDAAAQAKVNANINAEMNRMVKLGNDRYIEHTKHDQELQELIARDKQDTDQMIEDTTKSFNSQLADVRKTLAKDRKDNEDALAAKTQALQDTLRKNLEDQDKANAAQEEATRRMKMDLMQQTREAKENFQEEIKKLTQTVKENDDHANAEIEKLADVVTAQAVKSAEGRQVIKQLEQANKDELSASIKGAIEKGQKAAEAIEAKQSKADADTQTLINMKLDTEIKNLRESINRDVHNLELESAEALAQMEEEMRYAIKSAAEAADHELKLAIKDGQERFAEYATKAAEAKDADATARAALEQQVADNAAEVSTMINAAVANDARAANAERTAFAAKIKETNTNIAAYSEQLRKNAADTRSAIKAASTKILADIAAEQERAKQAVATFSSEDAARQEKVLSFLTTELAAAAKAADAKFGVAYQDLADHREEIDNRLAGDTDKLNDALAKQAALADARFAKTVKDLQAARNSVQAEVEGLRKAMATGIIDGYAELKDSNTMISDQILTVSAEVTNRERLDAKNNREVREEMDRIQKLANKRFTQNKKARGQLRAIMDENKQAAAAEVAALASKIQSEYEAVRTEQAHNLRMMKKATSDAADKFYTAAAAQQAAQKAAADALGVETEAAAAASAADLERAQSNFNAKITELTNLEASNQKHIKEEFAHITGVVDDYATASEADRELIKEEQAAMKADLHRNVARAISMGEAEAKATQQRILAHGDATKNYLLVQLTERTEAAADTVLKSLEGNRQKIADNYLSLKAYAVAVADLVEDYVAKGKGKGLSSIGDLLLSVSSMGAVKPPPAAGIGMGTEEVKTPFSGEAVLVSGQVAAINGLVDEFAKTSDQVRKRWPMGLGKYLMDRLHISMSDKGVLQVDKIEGKPGNFVYINGRSVGLSNKLTDFAELAATMSTYEASLSKLTAKIAPPKIADQPTAFVAPYMPATTPGGPDGWGGA